MKHFTVFRCVVLASSLAVAASSFADGNFATGVSSFTVLNGKTLGLTTSEALPTLTSALFADAQAGPEASTVPVAAGYIPNNSLSLDPSAVWIASNAHNGGFSTLFAVQVHTYAYTDAKLTVELSADDQLGDPNNPYGIYLDGNGLAGTATTVLWRGGVYSETLNLGAVSAGTHWLYFDVYNSGGGDSGLIATGDITTPSPVGLITFSVGAIGAFLRRKRR
jgi:hypothetical protein